MNNQAPSKFALRFLAWFCPYYLYEGIEGDLLEQFDENLKTMGHKRARRRFLWHVLLFFRPSIILRNNFKLNIINTIMLGNYFKITARTIMKSKLYSFINAFGLSIGMAFCMLIYLYIQDERSFDQFHANKDSIYRMEVKRYNTWKMWSEDEDMFSSMAYLQTALGPTLKEELPEVIMATRYNHGGEGVVTYGDKVFTEDLTYVDADFFQMFSFDVLEGNRKTMLSGQLEAVITPEVAKRYFGDESPINKVIEIDREGKKSFTITGIIAPPPANSSLTYNILIRQENRPYYDRNNENWGNFGCPTFVMLEEGTDMANFDDNLAKIVDKYMADKIANWSLPEEMPEGLAPFTYLYSKLTDIHLNTEIGWRNNSDPQYSMILGAIAILILIIACINYVSLALVTSKSRRVEVGVRKSIGANRSQVIYQFTFESIILAFVSMLFGLGLMKLFLPAFNSFTSKAISLDLQSLSEITIVGILISILVGVIAGSYPSLVLSHFKPAEVLKGNYSSKVKSGFVKPLVVLQFAMSAFLIVSSVIMYKQMEYITTKDLGYDKEQVLVIPTQTGWNDNANTAIKQMRQALSYNPNIVAVAGTSSSFNRGFSLNGYEIDGVEKSAYVYAIDTEYIPTLDIELVEGRNFDENISTDTTAIIVNEALVEDMEWENPLEEYLNWTGDTIGLGFKVVGVVKDFHFRSLEHKIQPMLMSMNKEYTGYLINMLVRISPSDIPATIKEVESEWRALFPDKPFDYNFMDEDIDRQYESYSQWMSIMGLATGFAILISCLGLFGISGVNALNRTKEIGIRKVMGAELSNIFILLNKQYIWLAIVAFAVASPLSWYVMNIWLSDFEFTITIGWEIFALSMITGLVVAIATVSYHAIKSALLNPADTLKYE